MYDELVKNLRGRSQFLLPHYGEETSYDSDLMKQAADAIEELIVKLNHADDQIERLVEAAEERRWIPVTERLPGESGDYLVYSVGGTWNQLSEIKIMFCDGERFFTSSFYCPIYWMPLPEPPKDDEV